jgi:hypothetical protein
MLPIAAAQLNEGISEKGARLLALMKRAIHTNLAAKLPLPNSDVQSTPRRSMH